MTEVIQLLMKSTTCTHSTTHQTKYQLTHDNCMCSGSSTKTTFHFNGHCCLMVLSAHCLLYIQCNSTSSVTNNEINENKQVYVHFS